MSSYDDRFNNLGWEGLYTDDMPESEDVASNGLGLKLLKKVGDYKEKAKGGISGFFKRAFGAAKQKVEPVKRPFEYIERKVDEQMSIFPYVRGNSTAARIYNDYASRAQIAWGIGVEAKEKIKDKFRDAAINYFWYKPRDGGLGAA